MDERRSMRSVAEQVLSDRGPTRATAGAQAGAEAAARSHSAQLSATRAHPDPPRRRSDDSQVARTAVWAPHVTNEYRSATPW